MTFVVLAYGEGYSNRIGVGSITDAGTEMGRFINEGAGRVSVYAVDPVKAELVCTTTVNGRGARWHASTRGRWRPPGSSGSGASRSTRSS